MLTPLATEIRHHLADYLSGVISLHAFQDWLVGATWNVESADDPAATELTYSIKLVLAEHAAGDISDAELHAELGELTSPVATIVLDASAWGMAWHGVTTSSFGLVREEALTRLASASGEPRVVGSW